LKQQAESAFFLEDLYYRISDFPLYIPPLRDRHKDIRLLAHHFITRFARETQVDVPGYTPSFMDALVSYEWPGNVRELEKCIKRAMVLMRSGDTLHQEYLPSNVAESGRGFVDGDLITPLRETLGEVECREISRALKRTGGNKSQASRILGISYPNLLKKIRLYGLIRR
jgi:transcriptional regulator with PAS, ATPase and Fis domain